MNRLWKFCLTRNLGMLKREYLFLILNTLFFSFIGFLFCECIRVFFISMNIVNMICFIGLFGFFIGFLGGIIFIYNK